MATPERSIKEIEELAKEYARQVYLVLEENHDPADEERALNNVLRAFTTERKKRDEMVEGTDIDDVLKEVFSFRTYGAYGVDHILTEDLLSVAEKYGVKLTQPNNTK